MRSHRRKLVRAELGLCCVMLGLGSLIGCSVDPHIERLEGRWQGKNSKAVFDLDAQGKGKLYLMGGIPGVLDGTCEETPCSRGECVTVTYDRTPLKQCHLPCTYSKPCGDDHYCSKLSAGSYCLSNDGLFPPVAIEAAVDSFNEYRVNFGQVDSSIGKPGSPILVGCRLDGDNLSCAEPGLFGDEFVPDNEFLREAAADGG